MGAGGWVRSPVAIKAGRVRGGGDIDAGRMRWMDSLVTTWQLYDYLSSM